VTSTKAPRWASGLPIVWLVGFLVLLAMPSSQVHRFNGLPFSRLSEYVVLMLVVPVLASRTFRRAFKGFWGRHRVLSRVARILIAVALALKVGLFVWAPPDGFLGCYRSPKEAPPAGPCERSYEHPFFRWSITRLDRAIDFGPANWNLSFINSLRWNFYPWVAGNILRDRLPLEVRWRGSIARERADVLEVRYVGAGTVTLGATAVALPGRYDREAVMALPVSKGNHRLAVSYTFDDGYRTGASSPPGPPATLRLRWSDGSPVGPMRPHVGWLLAGVYVDFVAVGCAAALVGFYGVVLRRDRWWLLGLSLAGPLMFWFTPEATAQSALLLLIVVCLRVRLKRRRAAGLIVVYLGLLYLGFFRRSTGAPDFRGVLARSAGSDWLTYESLGRSILESWSLEGGEPVFFYQPLVRYVSFLSHLLFGDGDTLIMITMHTLMVFAVLWCVARLDPRGHAPALARTVSDVAALSTAALIVSQTVVVLTRRGAAEVPTWIVLPLVISLLFASRSRRAWVFGAALLALCYVARPNQGPAVVWLLALFTVRALRIRPRPALLALGVFGVIAVLPLAHNLVYGHQFVVSSTSGTIPDNLDMPPAVLARALGADGPERRALLHKGALMLHAAHGPQFMVEDAPTDWVTDLGFHGLQAVWLATGLALLLARALDLRTALWLTPALYLGLHAVYVIHIYYPRHIVAGYLAMGLVSMLWWGRLRNSGAISR
jgi:hypothetical protein